MRTDFFMPPRFVNRTLMGAYRFEAQLLLQRLRLPFDVSVACVGRRG
ncbi:MAG: hypothetical protein ACREI8_05645 [Myxococcota bacterium]